MWIPKTIITVFVILFKMLTASSIIDLYEEDILKQERKTNIMDKKQQYLYKQFKDDNIYAIEKIVRNADDNNRPAVIYYDITNPLIWYVRSSDSFFEVIETTEDEKQIRRFEQIT